MRNGYKWYHYILLALGFAALAVVTVYVIVNYGNIPDEIPGHFNAAGEADSFGGKSSIVVPLIIGWMLYAVLALVGLFPAVWNTGVEVAPQNKEKVYSIIRMMLCVLTFMIAAFFSHTVYCAAQCTSLNPAALPIFWVLIFGTIIVSILRLVKSR